ncbi:hypothetical protein BU17DRAFT_93099 [Hysterangium stoloniferum]|nr:hypothetical protein BU17DRAFT_93099 [Hysterangium stoloniferum]
MPIATESLPNANGVDGITRMADVAGLPPTVTPSAAVTIPDSQLSDERKRAVKAYKRLREQWGCDEPGHDLCLQGNHYIAHIQLSQEQISIWIDEICRGQATCHHPPEMFIILDGSRPNRNLNFDWGASETNTDPEVEIGTGYFCGLVLERVGSTILYCSKVSLLLAKLSLYGQIVNHWSIYGNTGRRYKRPSAQRLGIILQETADLMRARTITSIMERLPHFSTAFHPAPHPATLKSGRNAATPLAAVGSSVTAQPSVPVTFAHTLADFSRFLETLPVIERRGRRRIIAVSNGVFVDEIDRRGKRNDRGAWN